MQTEILKNKQKYYIENEAEVDQNQEKKQFAPLYRINFMMIFICIQEFIILIIISVFYKKENNYIKNTNFSFEP